MPSTWGGGGANKNVFNSTISNAGVLVTSRTPSYRNNLGYDADLFRTTGVLGNDQKSTRVRLSTSNDTYQPGVVTIATDLYAPRIVATKTISSPTANLGDTLTYTMAIQNTGPDLLRLDSAVGDDPERPGSPLGRCSWAGSIQVNGAVVTDAPRRRSRRARRGPGGGAHLGTGATAGRRNARPGSKRDGQLPGHCRHGGLGIGRKDREHSGSRVPRRSSTRVPSTVTTAPAITNVNVPDLAIGKTHAPGAHTWRDGGQGTPRSRSATSWVQARPPVW